MQVVNNTIPGRKDIFELGHNLVLNDTEIDNPLKEDNRTLMTWVVNAKQKPNKYHYLKLKFIGQRCWGPCQPPVTAKPIETNFRYWSVPADWTSGKIPLADEAVEIEPGWNMVFDMPESPIVKVLTINGRLSFKNDTDLELKAKHIFVRAGELVIGYKSKPFANTAKITLYGEKDARAMVYDNVVEAGNKLIASVGNITIYGKNRDKMSRLHTAAEKGSVKFTVGSGLDWVAGDMIAIADTSFYAMAGETREIKTYNKQTGELEITLALEYYHWGASEGTEETYGKDIRGEVGLLTRNVKISGNDIESWGGQIVAGETLEANGEWRIAHTHIENAEIYNCSQMDTEKSAIRFQNAKLGTHVIKNSVISNGIAWGVYVTNAKNV